VPSPMRSMTKTCGCPRARWASTCRPAKPSATERARTTGSRPCSRPALGSGLPTRHAVGRCWRRRGAEGGGAGGASAVEVAGWQGRGEDALNRMRTKLQSGRCLPALCARVGAIDPIDRLGVCRNTCALASFNRGRIVPPGWMLRASRAPLRRWIVRHPSGWIARRPLPRRRSRPLSLRSRGAPRGKRPLSGFREAKGGGSRVAPMLLRYR
jgi:hypothetical protein